MIVKLWFEGENSDFLSLLNEWDRELLSKLHRGNAREQSAITQALMKLAAREMGFDHICITRSEKGAPVCDIPQLFLSASHTKGCCAAAASHFPVGIDVQPIEFCREKVMTRLFSEKEQHYVLNHRDKDYAFTQLWTLKEAYGKMKGIGLSAAKELEFFEENGQLFCENENLHFSTKQVGNFLISTLEQPSA